MDYICHSGGCDGADIEWENQGKLYGIKTISYSFYNHAQFGENQKILSIEELKEGFDHVMIANRVMKRNPDRQYPYIKNLLARNWFQVKNSESIFAISRKFTNCYKVVDGGTGWAVQMAIDNNKPVYVFDQTENIWTTYDYNEGKFLQLYVLPELTQNFAGIGTREISTHGKDAIKEIYKNSLTPLCCNG